MLNASYFQWFTYSIDAATQSVSNVRPFDRMQALKAATAVNIDLPEQTMTTSNKSKTSDNVVSNTDAAPTSTFNMFPTEAEKLSRDSVPLPHTVTQLEYEGVVRVGGQVVYVPDDMDDVDEEDPDDDLNI